MVMQASGFDTYEAKDEKTGTTLIAMQPLVADQAYMPKMKAMCPLSYGVW